jgi:transposase
MKIIKAILAGERDPNVLALNRQKECRNTQQTIAKSLVGNFRDEHMFALKQALDLYEIYQAKIAECEAAIVKHLGSQPDITDDQPPESGKTVRARERIRAGVDVRHKLFKMTGVDLFATPGFAADTLLTLASEVGFDMRSWPTVKHFTSWIGLCPGTRVSGGKTLDRRTKRNANRAAQAFRMAASSLARSQTALGAFYRRIRSRTGGKQAITATAHKLARLYYFMLTRGTTYVEQGQLQYEQMFKERRIKALKKQAHSLGYQLLQLAS